MKLKAVRPVSRPDAVASMSKWIVIAPIMGNLIGCTSSIRLTGRTIGAGAEVDPGLGHHRFRITVLTTGGTIEKTYHEGNGTLLNERSNVPHLVDGLRLPDLDIRYDHLFSKDSLEMTDADRATVLDAVRRHLGDSDGMVIVHGTDTLSLTGELLHGSLPGLSIPIVFTGAMKPLQLRDTDAVQNVTEALLACRLVHPGVYVAMHNRVLRFPGVVKDRSRLTFTHEPMLLPKT